MTYSSQFLCARDYCYRLLKFRPRSIKEVEDKLKQKKFSPEIAQSVIDYLKRINYLNDEEFCRQWINFRINKPLGLRRIRFELKQKGIAQELIASQIQNLTPAYAEDEVALEIAQKRFKRLKNLSSQKAKSRIYAFLMRRGFSPDTASDVLNKLKHS